MNKLRSELEIEVALEAIARAFAMVREITPKADVPAIHGAQALERLVKLVEPIKGKVWDRLLFVQVSPRKYIVVEPTVADWEYKAVTKPLDYADARTVMEEMRGKPRGEWSPLTVKSVIVLE